MLIRKLPVDFQSDPFISTIASYFEDKKVLFSSIVYKTNEKTFIINKNQQTPYFQKDWQCYSLVRCISNTIIGSAAVIRYEKDLYKSHFCCGDLRIEQMYTNIRENQRQNVFPLTNSMTYEELLPYFNEDYYNLMDLSYLKILREQKQSKVTLKQIISYLYQKEIGPILVDSGPIAMKQYFDSIRQCPQQNLIDGVYLAFFQGDLQQHSIGNQFAFEYNLYDIAWEQLNIFLDRSKQLLFQ